MGETYDPRFTQEYRDFLKKKNQQTKFGQAVPYKYGQQGEPKQFWAYAQEKIAQGYRLVPKSYKGQKEFAQSRPAPTWQDVRLPTREDYWKAGQGTLAGSGGRTYSEMQNEMLLAQHPGAVKMLDSGVPWYGGNTDVEERNLRIEATMEYGTRYIEDLTLDSESQLQFDQGGNLAEMMQLGIDAYGKHAEQLASDQDDKWQHNVYEGIFQGVGRYYHTARQKMADLMEAGLANGYQLFAGDENYNKEWAKQDAQMQDEFLTKNVYNPLTQLQGSAMYADLAENIFYQWLPWNWGKPDSVKSLGNVNNVVRYLQENPGVSESVAKNTMTNEYWSSFAEEWLNPLDWVTDKAIDLVFPPLAALTIGRATAKFLPRLARRGTRVTPELAKVLRKVSDASRLGGMSDEAFQVARSQGMVKAYSDDLAKTIDDLTKWSTERGIFSQTAETKASLSAEDVGDGVRWITGSLGESKDPIQFMQRMEVVGKLGSGDAKTIDMAMRELSRIPNFDFWFTQSGQTAAYYINKMMDVPKAKWDDIIKEVDEMDSIGKKVAALIAHSDNAAKRVTDEMFPTLEAMKKSGKKLAPHLDAAEKSHRQAQKVVGPIQQWFSNWYLGRTPGYAVRNAVQNFGQTIFDLGIGSTDGWKHIDEAFDWAGFDRLMEEGKLVGRAAGDLQMLGMERELSGIAGAAGDAKRFGEKGISKYFDARWWSNQAEFLGGRTIFGHEYPKEMRRILKGNLTKQYMELGLDKRTAKRFEQAIINNKGNMALARKEIDQVVSNKFWRNADMANLPVEMQQKADAYGMGSRIYKWVDESDDIVTLESKIDNWIDDTIEAAEKQVKKEGATSPPATAGTTMGVSANAVTNDGAPQAVHDIFNSALQANKKAGQLTGQAIRNVREMTVRGLVETGQDETTARILVQKWMKEVDLVVEGEKAAVMPKLNGLDYADNQRWSGFESALYKQEQGIGDKYGRGVKELEEMWDDGAHPTAEGLRDFWNKNFASDPRYGDYNGQTFQEVKRANYRFFTDHRAAWFNDWYEQNYNFARQITEHVTQMATDAGVQNLHAPERFFTKADEAMAQARKYQKWVPAGQRDYAIKQARKLPEEPRRLHDLAREYAEKFGVDSYFEKEGRDFFNHKKLVSIVNEQLGTDFDRLDNMTGINEKQIREAFKAHSLDQYVGIVDDPDSAIDLILNITDAGEFGNKSIIERLSRDELTELRRFSDLIATADEPAARELNNAINARHALPDLATAKNADQYNEMAKIQDEADQALSEAGDRVLDVFAEKKIDSDAGTWEILSDIITGSDEEAIENLANWNAQSEFFKWLSDADPNLSKKLQQELLTANLADNIADQVDFPADLKEATGTIKLAEGETEILNRAIKNFSAEQFGAIDQGIAETLVKTQKSIEKKRKTIRELADQAKELVDKKVKDSTEYVRKSSERSVVEAEDFIHLWGGEDAPTAARNVFESQDEIREFGTELKTAFRAQWDDVVSLSDDDALRMANDWQKTQDLSNGMLSEARMGAMRTVREKRDFILHNYGNRRNFDTMLAYIYPYHFWHTRNAANWVKRVAQKPGIARQYMRYKDRMERINSDMPEWFRQNTRVTGFMGFDEQNPLLINIEALVSPAYQVLKVPWKDENKRDTQFSKWLDDAGRVSSTHTIFGLMYGFGRYVQGDKEQGSAWMSRLIPQTKVVSALTSVLGKYFDNPAWERGIELDPVLGLQGAIENNDLKHYFSGLDPYEQKRIAMGYQTLVQQGKYTDEEVIDALMSGDPDHPITMEAHGIAQSKKNTGDLLGFLGGPGFQIRSEDEREIARMDDEFRQMWQYSEVLDKDEMAQLHQIMREKYPQYYNSVMLTRKNRDERESAFTYNVIARIPPGQGSAIYETVGIEYSDVQAFYDSKGEILETMPETERVRFMAGITELSAVAAFPDAATKNEWDEVKARNKNMREELTAFYGEETYAYRERFFELLRDEDGPEKAYQYLDQHPEVGDLMSDETQWKMQDPLLNKYYASFDAARAMLSSEMYDRLEVMYPGIVQKQEAYFNARAAGQSIKASDELKAYWADKEAMEEIYGSHLASYSRHIPQAGTVEMPKRFNPEEMEGLEQLPENVQQLATQELDKGGVPPQYNWSWQQWEQIMDPTLARLVQDWAFRGADLGRDAEKNLEYALEPFNIDLGTAMALMQKASSDVGAEFYSEENPPWWLEEE